ncbi:hypothetical protein CLU95_0687 [Variovorax sp. 54]|nr:hypothetical protein [Variovorax sp. 54]PIF73591.1 hypothetical protein CLU95_0687 [Variovorax sp. 54]
MPNLGHLGGEKEEVSDWKWLAKIFESDGDVNTEAAIAGKVSFSEKTTP